MYEPQNLTAWMTLGENQSPTSINFQSWLDGNELTIQQFNGLIGYRFNIRKLLKIDEL